MLQHLDLLGQGRLGHTEAAGCAAEMALLGHCQKQPEMADESEIDHG
nr:hypothetical protein [Aeromonas hydrophila]